MSHNRPLHALRRAALALLCAAPPLWAGMPISQPRSVPQETAAGPPSAVEAPWGLPLDGGPVRLLAVAPRETTGDVAALAARLEISAETVAVWDARHLGCDPLAPGGAPPGASAEETAARLRDAVRRPWDVAVLGNLDTAILPEDVLQDLFDRVAAGAGLVAAQLRDAPDSAFNVLVSALDPQPLSFPVRHGVEDTGLAHWGDGMEIERVFTHGAGRVVVVEYPGDPAAGHFLVHGPADPLDLDPVLLDNLWSHAARVVWTAAGRGGGLRIAALEDAAPAGPAPEEIPPDFTPEYVQSMRDSMAPTPVRPFRVVFEGTPEGGETVEVRLRRPGSPAQIIHSDPAPVPEGAADWVFDMVMGPGLYYLDARVLRGGRVVDWFTRRFDIEGWPSFSDLRFDKTGLQPNDTLNIALRVRPVLGGDRACTVHARATDPWERVLAEASRRVSNDGGEVGLALHFVDAAAPVVKIEVCAVEGEGGQVSGWELLRAPRAYRYVSVNTPRPPLRPEAVVLGPAPAEPAQEAACRALAAAGVEVLHAPGGEAALVRTGLAGLDFLPELASLAPEPGGGLVRRPCLHDEEATAALRTRVAEGAALHWAGTSGRFSLGGANCLTTTEENVCQSPETLDAFRRWLAGEHGSLETARAAWGNDAADWSAFTPMNEDQARTAGRAAPWMDFRRFMDQVFAQAHRTAAEEVRKLGRNKETGAVAPPERHAVQGGWIPGLSDAVDFLVAEYDPLSLEKLRSFRRPGAATGVLFPDAAALGGETRAEWLAWHVLLRQVPGLWLGTPFGDADHARPGALLSPDRTPAPAVAALLRAKNALRDGPGMLLLAAEPEPPAVLVLTSHASRYHTGVFNGAGSSLDAERAWAEALDRLHVPWAFVDGARLARLEEPSVRALVLPLCRALTPAETDAAARFAGRGGLLLADLLPGVADGHGVPADPSPLAALFGVERRADARMEPGTAPGGGVTVEAGVTAAGAEPRAQSGETPLWLVARRDEKPSALLLNHVPRTAPETAEAGLLPEEELLRGFFTEAGVLSAEDALRDFDGEVRHYRFGDTRLTALLARPGAKAQKVRPGFGKDEAVFDVLAGERVSRPHRHTVRLAPGGAALFAVTPAADPELTLNAPSLVNAGGRLTVRAAVTCKGGAAGRRLLRVEILPGGVAHPWNVRYVDCPAGAGEAHFALARSDGPAKGLIRVRDLLTGATAETTTEIGQAPTP